MAAGLVAPPGGPPRVEQQNPDTELVPGFCCSFCWFLQVYEEAIVESIRVDEVNGVCLRIIVRLDLDLVLVTGRPRKHESEECF